MSADETSLTDEKDVSLRRRCFWCAVPLRWWQINSCRACKRALVAPYVGPPCPSRSRWNAAPDRAFPPAEEER